MMNNGTSKSAKIDRFASGIAALSDISRQTVGGRLVAFALALLLVALLAFRTGHATELRLLDYGLRASVSGENVLGAEQPEDFQEYDATASIAVPWQGYTFAGVETQIRLLTGVGAMRGAGKTALVVSLIPVLAFGSHDERYKLDLGMGGAMLSRARFGSQDFGGPFQFALTAGAGLPLYQRLGFGYRFLHYSDAGLNGSDTVGADFHMLELSYRR